MEVCQPVPLGQALVRCPPPPARPGNLSRNALQPVSCCPSAAAALNAPVVRPRPAPPPQSRPVPLNNPADGPRCAPAGPMRSPPCPAVATTSALGRFWGGMGDTAPRPAGSWGETFLFHFEWDRPARAALSVPLESPCRIFQCQPAAPPAAGPLGRVTASMQARSCAGRSPPK